MVQRYLLALECLLLLAHIVVKIASIEVRIGIAGFIMVFECIASVAHFFIEVASVGVSRGIVRLEPLLE